MRIKRSYLVLIAVLGSLIVAQAQGSSTIQSLSLDSCRQLAINQNKALQIASEKERKAYYDKKAAFTQYLPNFSFTGSYLRNQKQLSLLDADKFLPIGTVMSDGSFGFTPSQVKGEVLPNGQWVPIDANGQPFDPTQNPEKIQWNEYTTIPKSEFDIDIRNVWVGVLSVVQPVYMGGKIAAYNKITQYAHNLAGTQKETELQNLLLETDQAYWQVVSLVNKQKLTTAYADLLRKMEEDVDHLINEGLATKADGLNVKVKRNEAEMAQTKVSNGLSLSRMLLAQICGLPMDSEIKLDDEEAETLSIPGSRLNVNVSEALLERPELKSLTLATQMMAKKEAIVRSELLPTIALTGSYMVTNPNSFNGFQKKFGGMWNIGVVVNVPIFHWGERFHNLSAAKAETRIKQLELAEAKEKVELQVNQSVFRLNEAEKTLLTAYENKESAAENLHYAQLGFSEGVISVSQVMEAQTAWLKAQSELIDAQIDNKLARVYLKKATGNIQKH